MASARLTHHGYNMLRTELQDLIEVQRPQVVADLAQAREYGDLSENAEYDIAKRDHSLIEGRIKELEHLLASVEIIEMPGQVEEACLGAEVRVMNLDVKQERRYTLVTEQEAHLVSDYLSVDSPLGRALLGGKVGDLVTFEAPAGTRRFQVLALRGYTGAA